MKHVRVATFPANAILIGAAISAHAAGCPSDLYSATGQVPCAKIHLP